MESYKVGSRIAWCLQLFEFVSHLINEGITVISLRMLALRQFVCFYSDALLKRSQPHKKISRKKKYHSFKPLG